MHDIILLYVLYVEVSVYIVQTNTIYISIVMDFIFFKIESIYVPEQQDIPFRLSAFEI